MFRKNTTLVTLFLVLLVVLLGFLYFQPLRDQVQEKQAEKQVLATQVFDLTEELAELEKLQEDLPESEVARKKILGKIPAELEQDQLVLDLSRLATEHVVDFSALSFGLGGTTEEGLQRVTVNGSFSGSYDNLVKFVEAIEENEREIMVKSVGVQLSETGTARFNLNMEAYYQAA